MADLATLILQCSMAVHPQTAQAVIQYESKGNQYALNTQVRSYYPRSREEAAARLKQALRAGLSLISFILDSIFCLARSIFAFQFI